MVSHWSVSDNKSPQIFRTLLSILADLTNAVVWVVSTRPVISRSSSLCTNPLVTVPIAPITIGIIVTFMLHRFLIPLQKVEVIIPLFTFFQFPSVVRRDSKVHNLASPLFFVDYYHNYNNYFIPYEFFFTQVSAGGLHWSLNDSRSPQVSRV